MVPYYRISFGNGERSQSEDLGFVTDVYSVQFPSSEVQPRGRVGRESARQRRNSEPSLVLALGKTFAGILLAAAFFKLCQDLLGFVSPQILKYVRLKVHDIICHKFNCMHTHTHTHTHTHLCGYYCTHLPSYHRIRV